MQTHMYTHAAITRTNMHSRNHSYN